MQDIPFSFYFGTIAARLAVTVILTGLIGWDRERLRKPAGLRTHILVGMGSALIMLISIVTGPMVNGLYQVDPRIVANVVTGIRFFRGGNHPAFEGRGRFRANDRGHPLGFGGDWYGGRLWFLFRGPFSHRPGAFGALLPEFAG